MKQKNERTRKGSSVFYFTLYRAGMDHLLQSIFNLLPKPDLRLKNKEGR